MIPTEIVDNIPNIVAVLKQHHVDRAYLFGSVCSGAFTAESDVDILIHFNKPVPFNGYAENMWEAEEQLSALLNRQIDLVPEHTLKNPYFISNISKNRVLLYE